MKKLPTLYKKTSTGAIQYWKIQSDTTNQGFTFDLGWIRIEHGQVGTDSPQITDDVIKEGKNAGKKNATTAVQQAELEAQAKWEKQLKKGYVQTMAAAQNDEIDSLIEGGVVPMLAQSFTKHGQKIKYPAYVQPKLDGIRCIAILKDGKCTLWSRTRKLVTGVPHIARAVESMFPGKDLTLDGELYNHQFKKDFEKIVSFVRQETPADGHEVVEYHVYDIVNSDTFASRTDLIDSLLPVENFMKRGVVRSVETFQVNDESQVNEWFEHFRDRGYEGAMLRNATGLYVNKRSYDLQKVKEFDDAEFDIVGVEEGRGKLTGHAIFVCRTEEGTQFLAKMKGDTERLKDYFDNHQLWQGKKLTVQYQGITAYGMPRFPVGVAIRDYE